MTFDLFVLPFFLGLITLLAVKYYRWISAFDATDKALIKKGLFTTKSLGAAVEVFMESLLHRKMFRRNALLGYMHMSFAMGWLLLIVCGNLESRIYSKVHINPPYYPIFLKFFVHDHRVLAHELMSIPGVFRLLMDVFLALVLSGLALALVKRASSHWFGLKTTSRHTILDRIAITTLWLIFPLRLLAESLTAATYQGGSFLTNSLGDFLGSFLPAETLAYPAWWAYSFALGGFFICLPYSRFMHIPTEVMLIFFRHYGIKPRLHFSSYSNFEIQACPKCGVCIDACPVGININTLRVSRRIDFAEKLNGSFNYLEKVRKPEAEVAYFAGCMTHLTPSVKKSMDVIFKAADVEYRFIDQDGSVFCGRPLWMAGKEKQARELIQHNKSLIESTNCKTLVLSCPICLKMFSEKYGLKTEILHHSQYILRLVEKKQIDLEKIDMPVTFHNPCELGRGCGIYEEPRKLIGKIAELAPAGDEKKMSVCCGGSLGSTGINALQRDSVSKQAVETLTRNHPEKIVTACPLCKKTLQKEALVEVVDLCELVSINLKKRKEILSAAVIYQEEKI
jgi:Fe-S oxidoreductase